MVSLDTNVIVRLLTLDAPEQTEAALQLIEREPVLVVLTVLLEVEWVLRDAYGISKTEINAAFGKLLETENVTVENESAVTFALEWHAAGLDFADALHLALSRSSESFATFDSRLRKRAAKLEGTPKVTAP